MLLILLPVSYLIGAIPFGLIVGLSKGIDIRKSGSGNIGASNVGRLLGKKYFRIVFALDLGKGLLPALAAGFVVHFQATDPTLELLWLIVAYAAMVGHMFSIFLGFKGGKGVATAAGILLGIFPYFTIPVVVGLTLWYVIFKITRYISVASIIGSSSLPVFYIIIGLIARWPVFGRQLPLLIAAILMALMIVVKHRGNIARLMAGTENRAPKS
jgi:glycerol-3-phosphate acyltransferase PlsY